MHVSRKTFYLEVEATDDIFALIDVQYAYSSNDLDFKTQSAYSLDLYR